jgi:hypothetical protein
VKIAVYTCVTGGYDRVPVPRHIDPSLDYYCYTDGTVSVPNPWQASAIDAGLLGGAKDKNRFVKLHPHRLAELAPYDATLYVDGSVEIVGDVKTFVTEQLEAPFDLFMFEHPFRDSTFAEGVAVVEFGHEWVWSVAAQLREYYRAGFPDNAGLQAGGVILRRNTSSWHGLMNSWWREYQRGTGRDQLSLGYASWQTRTSVHSLGVADPFFEQRVFRLRPHRHSSRMQRAPRRIVNTLVAFLVGYRALFGTPPPKNLPPLFERLRRRRG